MSYVDCICSQFAKLKFLREIESQIQTKWEREKTFEVDSAEVPLLCLIPYLLCSPTGHQVGVTAAKLTSFFPIPAALHAPPCLSCLSSQENGQSKLSLFPH